MIKASIISIGNEIINGQTADTNAAYLSRELLSINIPVVISYAIGDDIEHIARMLNLASDNADIVLITGGLGPTDDDLTRQGMAKFLGVELILKNELLEKIKTYFSKRDFEMPDKTKIQAYIPVGTKAIPNNLGTAAGIMAKSKNTLFFALPGVPTEMKAMFKEEVIPELTALVTDQVIVTRRLRCFRVGESSIAAKLGDLMLRGRNPLINCTAHYGVVTLEIVATAKNKDEAQKIAADDEKTLRSILGDTIYGTGDQTLAEVLGAKLAQCEKTLSTAESCTGGTLAKLLTDIPGASRYFTHGWITYSDSAKINELGVESNLIEKYGAVSSEVAEALAKGARKRAGADFAIGITGIAGPDGGTKEKPVGLVYISVDSSAGCETKRFIFAYNREYIRLQAAQTALNMLRLKLTDLANHTNND